MKRKICLLGATGSIGRSALDVIRANRENFDPVLFSAHNNSGELYDLKKEFPHAAVALSGQDGPVQGIHFTGRQGLLKAIRFSGADLVINGISGAAGLEPSLASIDSKMNLALANKETIVMAGSLVLAKAEKNNVCVIPVDSEHSAISKLLQAHNKDDVDEIILTASGGPFKNYPEEKFAGITPEHALAHPTWKMGPKITVDSATLANKGLEVIEAQRLFGFPPEKIKVIIHSESIVHSMVRLKNGVFYAQMSKPDMRLPIHDAMFWPSTAEQSTAPSTYGNLDFDNLRLNFEKPDTKKFPMLDLAYKALRFGQLGPVFYNAANEIAVEAFLNRDISFLEIPLIVGYVLDTNKEMFLAKNNESPDLPQILECDKKARQDAKGWSRYALD